MILADKIERVIEKQVEAIKDVKIDNITVWDSGSGKDGKRSTADFLQSFLKFAPGMESVYDMIGSEFPKFLQGTEKQIESAKPKEKIKEEDKE